MARVDSQGRIVLPEDVRERLDLTPGTRVVIGEEDGRVVVEPADEPERVIGRMEELLESTPDCREQTPYEELDPQSMDQVDTIRRGAERYQQQDENDGDGR